MLILNICIPNRIPPVRVAFRPKLKNLGKLALRGDPSSTLTLRTWTSPRYTIPGQLQQTAHQPTCLFSLLQITTRAIFLTSYSNQVFQFLDLREKNKPFRAVDKACLEPLPSCLHFEPHPVPLPTPPSVHMCFKAKAEGFPRTSSLSASRSLFMSQLKMAPF